MAGMRTPPPRVTWTALLATLVVVWVAVGIPTWHIQPFRPQTARGMAWSYALRDLGPAVTAAGVVLAIALAWSAWRATTRRLVRAAAVLVVALALAPAWFVRQNHFEWMFAPLDDVAYAATSEAAFLADHEMVMGVELGGDAVAFPIRQLAYHHLVNTTVGAEPIVATY
jgi:hypothetical protein